MGLEGKVRALAKRHMMGRPALMTIMRIVFMVSTNQKQTHVVMTGGTLCVVAACLLMLQTSLLVRECTATGVLLANLEDNIKYHCAHVCQVVLCQMGLHARQSAMTPHDMMNKQPLEQGILAVFCRLLTVQCRSGMESGGSMDVCITFI